MILSSFLGVNISSASYAQSSLSANVLTNTVDSISLSVPELMAALFEDPTNLELNFRVMQAQIATGNLEGAEATLERVLYIDPDSTIARILMADIQIQLGKFISAKRILDAIIENKDSPPQTVERAKELVDQIEGTLETRQVSGGFSFYLGQTENAFGRAKEEEILLFDLPFENDTKDKSDQVYGYRAYLSIVQELNYQTPTQFRAGLTTSGRETHDPSRSDVQTHTLDFSFQQNDAIRSTLGGYGSYTNVGLQEFSKSVGGFVSASTQLKNIGALTATLSASRNVYFPFNGVANNAGKTNRSYSFSVDLTRGANFGFVKLGLLGGVNNAQDEINDFRFEKAELTGFATNNVFALTATLARQWVRYDIADTFISAKRQKSETDSISLNLRYLNAVEIDDLDFIPFLRASASETKSNIPNYRKDSAEVSVGMEVSF